MFRQCLPQHHRKIYEYSLGVMMCAKASREAVNGKYTSTEAHHRHIMYKLFCGNLITILICMVKRRCSLAVKFAVKLQQPYGSYTAVCTGGQFFFHKGRQINLNKSAKKNRLQNFYDIFVLHTCVEDKMTKTDHQ